MQCKHDRDILKVGVLFLILAFGFSVVAAVDFIKENRRIDAIYESRVEVSK